jgi:hypothetical protein
MPNTIQPQEHSSGGGTDGALYISSRTDNRDMTPYLKLLASADSFLIDKRACPFY